MGAGNEASPYSHVSLIFLENGHLDENLRCLFNFHSGMPIFTINLGISIGIGMHENGHPGAHFQLGVPIFT